MKENKRIARTLFVSGFAAVLLYLINFFVTRFCTEIMGIELYGFVSIAKTIVNYGSILTIALTSFAVRYIALSYHEKKYDVAGEYYSSSMVGIVVICSVLLIVAIPMVVFIDRILVIPSDSVNDVRVLFLLIMSVFILTTINSPCASSAYIKNKLDVLNIIKIVSYIIEVGALFVLFKCFNAHIWFVGIASLLSAAVIFFGNIILKNKYTPEVRFGYRFFSMNKLKDLVVHGAWNSVNQLGNVLNSGLDLIVSNLMLTGVQTGQISVAKSIGTLFSTLYITLLQPFVPELLKSYSSGNEIVFKRSVKKAMVVCGGICNIAFAGFASLGTLYYKLWLPNEDSSILYLLTVVTVFLSVTSGVLQPVYYINTLTLKNRGPCVVTVIGGLLNVGSMYFLLRFSDLQSLAVVATTLVIMTCINVIYVPIHAANSLNYKPLFFLRILFFNVISAIIMCFAFYIVAMITKPASWAGLIMSACLMVPIGGAVHYFVAAKRKVE